MPAAKAVPHIPLGTVYNRWTTIAAAYRSTSGHARILCRCVCGEERDIYLLTVQDGRSKSCGCLRDELAGPRATTHGGTSGGESRTYIVWRNMRRRCYDRKDRDFKDYGGRGIVVCDRWRESFANFLADMGEAPLALTIERNNTDGNYEPTNCRWATRTEQARNKRTNMLLTVWCDDVDVTEAAGLPAVVTLLRTELQGLEQEAFVIVCLGANGRPIAIREVARGLADQVIVPVRELFRTALMCNARALILSHNHPGGDPTPSDADNFMTAALRKAGALINCPIYDHIIIGAGERYYSYAKGRESTTEPPPSADAPRQMPDWKD